MTLRRSREWVGLNRARELLTSRKDSTFITVDRNLSFQQDLPRHNIAVIVLRAPSNRVNDLRPLVPKLLALLPTAKRGEALWIGA